MYKYIKAFAKEAELKMSSQHVLAITWGMIGFCIASLGFLVSFFYYKPGFIILSLGIIIGCISVFYGNLNILMNSIKQHKADKKWQKEFENRKQPWE